ncbi:MAG: ATP-binding cassette domain-containing protein [Planctomycetaceae bacterium]|nr:ATP-binding cassette domain-containing protein [Planctomycetaceae bacterium]
MTAVLEVTGVTKRYGSLAAVQDLSFRLEPGTVTGFIGPNGAGKTTTLRMCATLELPDEGEVRIAGRSALDDPRAARRVLGFMPDTFGAYTNTTVAEYLDFFARAYGLAGAERREALQSVVDFTGLAPLVEKHTSVLSKGMKQRLCLAKTLLHDPKVLLLDEPTAGLDPRARVEFRDLVLGLAQLGKALLVSSHILTELAEFCDSVAIVERGKLVAAGRIDDVQGGLERRQRVRLRVLGDPRAASLYLAEQRNVTAVSQEPDHLRFELDGDERALAELLAALVSAGLQPVEFSREGMGLQDLFLRLTGREAAQ